MAIVLEEKSWPKRTVLFGHENFDMAAGQRLKIETSPDGEEILDVEVPAGKTWAVRIQVDIEETDV